MTRTSAQPAIRKAGLQDVDALKSCIDRAYQPVKSNLPDLPDVSAGIADDIRDHHVLVAELGRRITGCAIFSLKGSRAHLMNIAVDPDVKGQGLGRCLIEHVERIARDGGATEIHLATHVGMPGNVTLYSHLGWSETSITGNKILMKKDL
ncbi:GNAT family N-acetyltransferase [Roseibium sp. Sym1]|uniref:GNAT family N-acetyltransferase n=1 Tax=Roseibium sp. Sym1 TaxID=3016006 RepID=UPI0022B53C1D|nr:GNAT family N-acetyltransferase [Roseibium sp. Sym1]